MAVQTAATKILRNSKILLIILAEPFIQIMPLLLTRKKVFFSGTEYERTVNRNGIGQHLGCTPINLDSDWVTVFVEWNFSMLSIYQLVTKHFQRVISQQ